MKSSIKKKTISNAVSCPDNNLKHDKNIWSVNEIPPKKFVFDQKYILVKF